MNRPLPLPAHRNRQLFSNHYLAVRLPTDPLWDEIAAEAAALRVALQELHHHQSTALMGANESQTEERWCQPVLRALGWGYEVQPVSRRQGTVQVPDYALFLSQEEADRAASASDRRRILKVAASVMEAKRWRRDLDTRDLEGADRLNQVPSTQIINYLIRAEQPWGILTNGATWRLYYRDADFADTTFFAVDLLDLLDDQPLSLGDKGDTIPAAEAFRYFYLFFRPASFRVEAEAKRWLDLAYQSSVRYARAVEEALKPRAYSAIAALCRGFAVAHEIEPRRLAAEPALAKALLDNALTLLFRLLFLLYAESRDLLPVRDNPAYREKSLVRLRERAAHQRDSRSPLFPRGRDFWNDLRDLFQIVDGNPAWRAVGVPVYNGGLFDPTKNPWLEDHYVADPELAEAIDLLSRTADPATGGMHYVDYGPLDVRNLGSIYEGLLEHVLRVDDRGALYLANEKGERKVSGSYYTPSYIVEYIVEKTLRPLVERRTPEEILGLKVLDPAMGSGHFLVSATSFLVRAAVGAVENEQGILGDLAKLDPERLRRLVVERCIFGVDKNPRAVELAKLSLWIATVQRDKPLNFLDHHLKIGDSLLGAPIDRMGRLPGTKGKTAKQETKGQINAFESAYQSELIGILDSVHAIETSTSDTLSDLERKETLHQRVESVTDRYRSIADLWCGTLFDSGLDADRYGRAIDALHGFPGQWESLAHEMWMLETARIASAHRFFHWELEFSEVFFVESGGRMANPGFNAVIGNPPYVRMEEFKEIKDFLRALYETYATRSDLYVYFMERSLNLLRRDGRYGAIISNKFLRAGYGKRLRAFIGRGATIEEIIDFGELPVFEETATMPAIVLARRGAGGHSARYAAISTLDFENLATVVDQHAFEVDQVALSGEEWLIAPAGVTALVEKLDSISEPLGLVVNGQIAYGVKTGLNEAFFIDDGVRQRLIEEDSQSAEVIKPLVVGTDIRHYHLDRSGEWLIYLPHGTDIDRYPAVEEHLARFREQLEKRATQQAWFELQQPQEAYVSYFEGPKILYPEMALEARFAFDPGPLYPNNKCFLIPRRDGYLLALLNSRLAFFYLGQICSVLGDPAQRGRLELRAQYMERLPIRRIPEATPASARDEMGEWLRSLYFRGLKLAGIEPEIPSDIRQLGPWIGELSSVEQVILIGSWARGHAREDSDIDLVVVVHENGTRPEQHRAIRRHIRDYSRPVDLILYTSEELERAAASPASFIAHVLPEGVVLHAGA